MVENKMLTVGDWRKLAESGELELKVISNSMHPTLRIGDLVKVKPLQQPPNKGVVTVFYKAEESPPLIVHRCIGEMNFRGDNRVLTDPPVEEDQLVGYVTEFIRNGKIFKVDGSLWVKLHVVIRKVYIRARALLGKIKRLVKRK